MKEVTEQQWLDAFIERAGFSSWENVESAARAMARQAYKEAKRQDICATQPTPPRGLNSDGTARTYCYVPHEDVFVEHPSGEWVHLTDHRTCLFNNSFRKV